MDGSDVALVVQAGEQLFAVKLLMTSIQCLWMYDYFLTLGDEINYAWSGAGSWVFMLFIANRYTPVLHLVWVHTTMFHYVKSFCKETKWVVIFHSSAVTFLSQIAVALRVYAVTERNRLIGGTLALLIALQSCFGIFSIVWVGLHPLQPIPEINLDAFKFCLYKRWRLGELIYYNQTILFDILVFLIILVTARRSRYPGIPTLWDTIVGDATQYFMLIFFVQFLALLFMFIAPEGIQLMPGAANTIFVPIMASRLMLSLKKAAAEPRGLWSLKTMTTSQERSTEDGTIYFASRVPGGLREISRTSTVPNEEDVELDVMSQLPRNHG